MRALLLLLALTFAIPRAADGDTALERRIDRQLESLRKPDVRRRRMAIAVLANIGTKARRAIKPLLVTLQADDEPSVRAAAADAIGLIARPAKGEAIEDRVVAVLLKATEDRSSDVRGLAFRSLGRLFPQAAKTADVVPAMIDALRDTDEAVRLEVVEALTAAGASAVAPLIEALGHKALIVRRLAARALEGIGPPAASATDALVRVLADDDKFAVLYATRALANIGGPAIPALAKALDSDRPTTRRAAIEALAGAGKAAAAAVPALSKIVADNEDPKLRALSCWALGRIATPPKDVLAALRKGLADAKPEVRGQAAGALGALGKVAVPAVDSLIERLKDKTEFVVDFTAEALRKIGMASSDEALKAKIEKALKR